MKNNNTIFECTNCGAVYPKWQGQCTMCNEWNTLIEQTSSSNFSSSLSPLDSLGGVADDKLSVKEIKDVIYSEKNREKTNFEEFDRVLGGGFIAGQTVLLSGQPGIGKSTLLLQLANNIKGDVYYLCGEESTQQVKQRYTRLALQKDDIHLLDNAYIETIANYLSNHTPKLLIVDSVHSLYSARFKSLGGSIAQIKYSSQILVGLAKKLNFALIMVGQVNKEGEVAGPKTLEHLVDTVLSLEGDENYDFRVLRATKNRYGSVNETGLFLMTQKGLEQIANPSKYFLQNMQTKSFGSAITICNTGNRCFAIEIQSLAIKTSFGYPKRVSNGFNLNRLSILLAMLEAKFNYAFSQFDIYLNVASGLTVNEPASDLAICASLISSITKKPIGEGVAFFGEVGLNGEVRAVTMTSIRKREAESFGFTKVYYPQNISNIAQLKKQFV